MFVHEQFPFQYFIIDICGQNESNEIHAGHATKLSRPDPSTSSGRGSFAFHGLKADEIIRHHHYKY